MLDEFAAQTHDRRFFDLGCGSGTIGYELTRRSWDLTGVDPSEVGIEQARATHPELKLARGSAYDDLATQYGQFPVVLGLKVVEHFYAPRRYVRTVFGMLTADGTAIISTTYHGYWTNLALTLTGRMHDHFIAPWHHGDIKLWSTRNAIDVAGRDRHCGHTGWSRTDVR